MNTNKVQTAIMSTLLWLDQEIKLKKLWLTALLAVIILAILLIVIELFFPNTDNIFLAVAIFVIAIPCYFAFFLAMIVTWARTKRFVKVKMPWLIYLGNFVLILIGIAIIYQIKREDFLSILREMFLFMGFFTAVMILIASIIFVAKRIHRRLRKL